MLHSVSCLLSQCESCEFALVLLHGSLLIIATARLTMSLSPVSVKSSSSVVLA
jgi:hypothetical protein